MALARAFSNASVEEPQTFFETSEIRAHPLSITANRIVANNTKIRFIELGWWYGLLACQNFTHFHQADDWQKMPVDAMVAVSIFIFEIKWALGSTVRKVFVIFKKIL